MSSDTFDSNEQVLRQCYFLMAICFCTDGCTAKGTLSFLDTGKW